MHVCMCIYIYIYIYTHLYRDLDHENDKATTDKQSINNTSVSHKQTDSNITHIQQQTLRPWPPFCRLPS